MYVVMRRTWFAGADPSDWPDASRVVARVASRHAAEAKAESLAPGGRDDGLSVWRAKAPNALHVFEVAKAFDV